MVLPKTLPRDPLESVPIDGATRAFFRDRESQSRAAQAIRSIQHGESDCSGSFGMGENSPKLGCAGESECARKTRARATGRICGIQIYGVKRLRPLARRALRTLSPFRVALRARNP